MKHIPIALAILTLAVPVLAGDHGNHEDWIKKAIEKEARRAKEAADYHGDIEQTEKKYGWMKEQHPEKYAAMISTKQAAANAWADVASRIPSVSDPKEIQALKLPAYKADAEAEMARLELRAASAEAEWKQSVEKTGSADVSAIADELTKTQSAILKTTRQKMASEIALRDLEQQRHELEQKMRGEVEKAKKMMHKKHKKK